MLSGLSGARRSRSPSDRRRVRPSAFLVMGKRLDGPLVTIVAIQALETSLAETLRDFTRRAERVQNSRHALS